MLLAIRVGFIALLWFGISSAGLAQTAAKLQTSDTEVSLQASPAAPRLVSLSIPGQAKWENRASETLIDSVEIAGQHTPLHWTFNSSASQISDRRVAFVYDSASPHLRLTWEWRAPQAYGPLEHQIRNETLDSQ